MVDTHYDLLTVAYVCYLKKDYQILKEISKSVKNSGVSYIFANLYFMSKEEMINELHKNYYSEDVSILEMFKISKSILEKYLPNTNFVYSIEGCDYLKIEDLEPLYNSGLRAVILVWNERNKYGSGNRTMDGLTKEGVKFLNKAISLGMGIDLSHANDKTFFDMIEVIKENQKTGKEVICYASHSNSRRLYNRLRNLTDNQILTLKEVGGLIGIFSNKNFVSNNNYKDNYLEHIIYVSNLIGVDNVMLSTDDMSFMKDYDEYYLNSAIFDYSTITNEIRVLLSKIFSTRDTNKIMLLNCYNKIISKLNK